MSWPQTIMIAYLAVEVVGSMMQFGTPPRPRDGLWLFSQMAGFTGIIALLIWGGFFA